MGMGGMKPKNVGMNSQKGRWGPKEKMNSRREKGRWGPKEKMNSRRGKGRRGERGTQTIYTSNDFIFRVPFIYKVPL